MFFPSITLTRRLYLNRLSILLAITNQSVHIINSFFATDYALAVLYTVKFDYLSFYFSIYQVRTNMLLQKVVPYEEEVPPDQLKGYTECSYKFNKDPDDS